MGIAKAARKILAEKGLLPGSDQGCFTIVRKPLYLDDRFVVQPVYYSIRKKSDDRLDGYKIVNRLLFVDTSTGMVSKLEEDTFEYFFRRFRAPVKYEMDSFEQEDGNVHLSYIINPCGNPLVVHDEHGGADPAVRNYDLRLG